MKSLIKHTEQFTQLLKCRTEFVSPVWNHMDFINNYGADMILIRFWSQKSGKSCIYEGFRMRVYQVKLPILQLLKWNITLYGNCKRLIYLIFTFRIKVFLIKCNTMCTFKLIYRGITSSSNHYAHLTIEHLCNYSLCSYFETLLLIPWHFYCFNFKYLFIF